MLWGLEWGPKAGGGGVVVRPQLETLHFHHVHILLTRPCWIPNEGQTSEGVRTSQCSPRPVLSVACTFLTISQILTRDFSVWFVFSAPWIFAFSWSRSSLSLRSWHISDSCSPSSRAHSTSICRKHQRRLENLHLDSFHSEHLVHFWWLPPSVTPQWI